MVVSISACASVVGIPVGITSSAVRLKVCVITAWIKKHESINKKKERRKYNKIVLKVEVIISKTFIDSFISQDEFIPINNVLKIWWN